MRIYLKPFLFSFFLSLIFQSSMLGMTDRYRCMWQDDPSTSMVIGWDQISGHSSEVYYDVVDWGKNVSSYNYKKGVDRTVDARGMNNHFARLTGLYPNTVYYFIIKDSEGLSARMSFKTAPNHSSTPLSIIAGGDSRNHRKARCSANKVVAKLRAHCVMFGGDMTGGDDATQWKGWFDDWQLTISKDGRLTPIIPARGNHEKSNQTLVDLFDIRYDNIVYGLTLGGDMLRIYTLNSLIASGGSQRDWLENDLNSYSDVKWKFAQYHMSIRPHTRAKSERNSQMKNWASLFYNHGVDLVCESDAHMVKTTYPIRPSTGSGSDEGFIRDDERGTVYVGEGCWGAPLRRNNDDKSWTRASGSFNQFKWIHVFHDRVEVRTIKTDESENARSVNQDDLFAIPKGLKMWAPSTGKVLTLNNQPILATTNYPVPGNAEPKAEVDNYKKEKQEKSKVKSSKPKELPSTYLPTEKRSKPKNPKKDYIKPQPIKVKKTEILGFKAIIENGKTELSWITKNENRNSVFEVQKSINGKPFQTFAVFNGSVSLHENTYRFENKKIDTSGKVNFRIRHELPDGSIILSNADVKKVKKENPEWYSYARLQTDPSTGQLQFKYRLEEPTDVNVKLYDNESQEIIQREFNDLKPGSFLQSIDVSQMPSGNYLLIIEANRKVLKKYMVEKRI